MPPKKPAAPKGASAAAPTKSRKRCCSLEQFIEKNEPELASIIKDLCVTNIMFPTRRIRGVTFVRPSADLMREIKKQFAASDEQMSEEAGEAAVRMVLSLFIPDLLLTPESFNAGPVGSRSSVMYTIKSTTGGKIVVANPDGVDAEIEADGTFAARSTWRAGGLAKPPVMVWKLTKGTLPLASAEPYRPPARTHESDAAVTGGGEKRARFTGWRRRTEMWENVVQNLHDLSRSSAADNVPDLALTYTAGLFEWMRHHANGKVTALFNQLKMFITPDPLANFVIFLSPQSSTCPIPDDFIASENMSGDFMSSDCWPTPTCEHAKSIYDAIFADVGATWGARGVKISEGFHHMIGTEFHIIKRKSDRVAEHYAALEQNVLFDVTDAYPEDALALIKSDPTFKAYADYTYYRMWTENQTINSHRENNGAAALLPARENAVGHVKDFVEGFLAGRTSMSRLLGYITHHTSLASFVRSTAFMYTSALAPVLITTRLGETGEARAPEEDDPTIPVHVLSAERSYKMIVGVRDEPDRTLEILQSTIDALIARGYDRGKITAMVGAAPAAPAE